jgi:hypothetical protein
MSLQNTVHWKCPAVTKECPRVGNECPGKNYFTQVITLVNDKNAF